MERGRERVFVFMCVGTAVLHLVSCVTFDPSPLQILANPKNRFNTSSLYKKVTLVAWDPAPYAVNLHKVCGSV